MSSVEVFVKVMATFCIMIQEVWKGAVNIVSFPDFFLRKMGKRLRFVKDFDSVVDFIDGDFQLSECLLENFVPVE